LTDPTKDIRQAVLEDLLAAPADLRRIARKQRIPLDELGRMLAEPETIATLRAFTGIHDATASLAIGRARINAIKTLKSLARDTEHPETSRKACVDLIKCAPAQLAPSASAQDAAQPSPPIDDQTRAMLRQALDAVAAQSPEDDA